MLDILGSLLMDEFYASEIWQPVPNTPKRKKAKARRKPGERYVPNYSYKPRGEKPWEYYTEKIESVGEWLVNEAKDVNYALRVYEGWLEQAIKNITKGEWYHAVLIIDVLFWEVARYHYVHGKNYPKQQARMRKLERAIMEQDYKLCEYSKEKNLNWVEEDLKDLYRLLEREPFSKNEGGFDMPAYINKVLLLLPEDKAQEWRDAHPTKEDLLKKEVKIELPKRIPFPDGILDQDKSLLLYSVFPSLPFDEYVSMAMSLFRLFLDEEKTIKSFKIFSSDDMKRLKSDFEEFNIVAHHIKPRTSYESNTHQLAHLVSSLFILCYDMGEFTKKKRTFVKTLIDKVSDVIWRDWDSDKLRDEIKEKQDVYQSRQRLEEKLMAEMESLKNHISKLEGEGLAEYLMDKYKFLSKKNKLLCRKHGLLSEYRISSIKSNLEGMRYAADAGRKDMSSQFLTKSLTDFMNVYQIICRGAYDENANDSARQKYAKKVLEELKEML